MVTGPQRVQPRTLRVATRKSALALAQTALVVERLERSAGVACEIIPMTTKGDAQVDRSLVAIGGDGVFVKELMGALLDGRADIAVHSAKDLPTSLPDALTGAVTERADARDALVSVDNRFTDIASLPQRATVGTSSLRRVAQLRLQRPDLQIVPLRGNVDTRLSKVTSGDVDAAVLALAGLLRLKADTKASSYTALDPEVMVPAVGQGALFVQCRADDLLTRDLVAGLEHEPSARAIELERAFLAAIGGGCVAPIGAYAEVNENSFAFLALVAATDGTAAIRRQVKGVTADAAEARRIVEAMASEMLAAGAREIVESARQRESTTL